MRYVSIVVLDYFIYAYPNITISIAIFDPIINFFIQCGDAISYDKQFEGHNVRCAQLNRFSKLHHLDY